MNSKLQLLLCKGTLELQRLYRLFGYLFHNLSALAENRDNTTAIGETGESAPPEKISNPSTSPEQKKRKAAARKGPFIWISQSRSANGYVAVLYYSSKRRRLAGASMIRKEDMAPGHCFRIRIKKPLLSTRAKTY